MLDPEKKKKAIQAVIQEMMDSVMNKVLREDPFRPENHCKIKPLYASLVPDEIFKGSHFERRFVTPFGTVWERLAIVIAKQNLGIGIKGHKITGLIRKGRIQRISVPSACPASAMIPAVPAPGRNDAGRVGRIVEMTDGFDRINDPRDLERYINETSGDVRIHISDVHVTSTRSGRNIPRRESKGWSRLDEP